jgi:hypothetical protein
MIASGHGDLAAQSLLAIAMRCYWGNLSQQTRSAVAAAAERLPLAGNEPTLLAILALADPVQRGALVNDRMSQMTRTLRIRPGCSCSARPQLRSGPPTSG